jgi:sulfatase maturation enzyme AslB (radical SAM superfamily)
MICDHWKQQHTDLSVDAIHQLIHSKTISNKSWLVEGGEVFCHPEINEVLALLNTHKVNYTLFTNGTMTGNILSAVNKYKIKNLNISLDGTKETYKIMRGFDGHDQVLKTIDAVKDKTCLAVSFTASPWNTYEDYLYVKGLCAEKNIRLMFNIYSEAANTFKLGKESFIDERYIKNSDFPYTLFYNKWVKGEIKVPCLSQLFTVSIFPSGNVYNCVCKLHLLGNIYKDDIDFIWNRDITKYMQRNNLDCNGCWVSCFRQFDVKLAMLKGQI